ncbi:MAG: hypothetical protein AAF485_18220 [Chloroflexota bacterium]
MSEWEVIIEDGDLSEERPRRELPSFRFSLRWLFIAGIIVIVPIAVYFAIRQQQNEQRATIQQDLEGYVFEEETVRLLRNQDRVAEMIIPNAPSQWQDDYRRLLSEEMPCEETQLAREISYW